MCAEQEKLRTKQAKFIRDEIWILTFAGGFQRAGVYTDNVSEKKRKEFRWGIRNRIESIVHNKYETTEVSSGDHIKALLDLKEWIDSKYYHLLANQSHIIAKGEITLGVVQKLLNLYLKYQWCLSLVCMPPPPHCPFDRIVISKMNLCNPPAWTQMNSVQEYEDLVNKASEEANKEGCTIAEWELNLFLENRAKEN